MPKADSDVNPPTGVRRLTVPASVDMVNVLGPRDEFLRILERDLAADVHVRGNEFTFTGEPTDVTVAAEVLTELVTIVRTGQGLTADAVERVVGMTAQSAETLRPAEVLTQNILSSRGRTIRPKTLNQKRYVDAIDAHTVVFGIGPAGTGKTYLAMAKAVQALQAKEVNRIILTRPAIEAGERLGFLPGTLTDKIDPYLRPLYDALHDMVDPDSVPRLLTAGTIEVAPLAYMRGRSLNDAFIILDEAQNTSMEQMKMFLTRLGFGSKIVVTGDVTQVDLPTGTRSGLRMVEGILDGVDDIAFCRLTNTTWCGTSWSAASWPPTTGSSPPNESTDMSVEVNNESGVPVDEQRLVALALFALDALRIHPQAELSVLLVDEPTMAAYHEKYMDEPGPTDVLSFPMDELRPPRDGEEPPLGMLGDIVLCPTVTAAQAADSNRTPDDEADYLLIHGLLHLLGHDHAEPDEKKVMFDLNDRIIAGWKASRR